jgi:hypothetical protein
VKTKVVTFKPLPGYRWFVEIHLHPNHRSAARQYRALYPDDDMNFKAVTNPCDPSKGKVKDLLARVIFYKSEFTIPIAAHEAAHVGLHFVRFSGLDVTQTPAEELYAEVVEATVKNTLDNLPRGW